jgi:hypothetical protein
MLKIQITPNFTIPNLYATSTTKHQTDGRDYFNLT